MNCSILSTLYLRANGDIPCYDDAGGNLCLSSISENQELNPADIFHNPMYTHIRESLQEGRMPWTNVCSTCAMLRPNESYVDLLSQRKIKTFQIEPTLACALACPGCGQQLDLKNRRKPYKLSLDLMDNFLKALSRDEYQIDLIEYCGNGEPLNHPQFCDFTKIARRSFPRTKQRLVTNGNFDYKRTLDGTHIDQIFVSCDGVKQSSYEKYRRGGNVDRVIKFMTDIPREVAGYRQLKIWKYILFEFNDSDDELVEAQRLRRELGFDQLMFVVTHSPFASIRFTPERIFDLPIVDEGVFVDYTPIHGVSRRSLKPEVPLSPLRGAVTNNLMMLDNILVLPDGRFHLSGWALSRRAITSICITYNGRHIGEARTGEMRLDVFDAFPFYDNTMSGYSMCWLPDNLARENSHLLEIIMQTEGGGYRRVRS